MPGCVLRIGGTFSAAELLARYPLPEPSRAEDGCVLIVASERDGSDFAGQIVEATQFLVQHRHVLAEIARATACPPSLDFGLWLKYAPVQSVRFPLELIALAAEACVTLEATLYAAAEDG